MIVGCSDADRHFHHFELCVCSNESFDDYKFLFQSIVLAVNKNLPGKSIDPQSTMLKNRWILSNIEHKWHNRNIAFIEFVPKSAQMTALIIDNAFKSVV